MDRFTRTEIPAQHPGLACSGKRTLFANSVLTAIITVIAKYLIKLRRDPRHNMQARPRQHSCCNIAGFPIDTLHLFIVVLTLLIDCCLLRLLCYYKSDIVLHACG